MVSPIRPARLSGLTAPVAVAVVPEATAAAAVEPVKAVATEIAGAKLCFPNVPVKPMMDFVCHNDGHDPFRDFMNGLAPRGPR